MPGTLFVVTFVLCVVAVVLLVVFAVKNTTAYSAPNRSPIPGETDR